MNKRAIAILGAIFIIIIGALGFLIYSRSNKNDTAGDQIVTENPNPTPEPTIIPNPTIEAPTPTPDTGRAIRLTDSAVISPILFYQGNGITYFERTGQLFRTELQATGTSVLLSNKQEISIALKNNISKVLWPLVGNSFIAEFSGIGKKTWSYYDVSKSAYVDLPSQVYSLDWMPNGDKIMFVWVDENNKASLTLGNPDTSGYQTLTDLYEPDNIIKVSPDGKSLLFYRNQTTDLIKNTINMVNTDGKSFRTVIPEGYNKEVKWSPDSSKFLFTKRDSSGKFNLWFANLATGEVRNLNIATSVDKAVWTKDGQKIYAGVPTKGTAGEGLTEDQIFQIDLNSAAKVEYPTGLPVDAQEMFLSKDESILFFKNAQDQSLYYINVKNQVSVQGN